MSNDQRHKSSRATSTPEQEVDEHTVPIDLSGLSVEERAALHDAYAQREGAPLESTAPSRKALDLKRDERSRSSTGGKRRVEVAMRRTGEGLPGRGSSGSGPADEHEQTEMLSLDEVAQRGGIGQRADEMYVSLQDSSPPPHSRRPRQATGEIRRANDAHQGRASKGQASGRAPLHLARAGQQVSEQQKTEAPQLQSTGSSIVSGPLPGNEEKTEYITLEPGFSAVSSGSVQEEHTEYISMHEAGIDALPHQGDVSKSQVDGDNPFREDTEYINLNELADDVISERFSAHMGSQTGRGAIENDALLRQSYLYGAESIQEGQFILVFARNALGKDVVLKRVWEGSLQQIPEQIRRRLAVLDSVRHPHLLSMAGMVATETGCWVELPRPEGVRLTQRLVESGPVEPAEVQRWLPSIVQALEAVHQNGLLYANLTPDAIWLDGQGQAVLEPFDLLAFEERGHLGAFGPPELQQSDGQAHISPKTDYFSLAAVVAAACVGIPLDFARVAHLPSPLQDALRGAMAPDPAQRPDSLQPLVDSLQGKQGSLIDKLFGRGAKQPAGAGVSTKEKKAGFGPDIKVVVAIAVVLLAGLTGYLYLEQQKTLGAKQAGVQQNDKVAQAAQAREGAGNKPLGEQPEEAATADLPIAETDSAPDPSIFADPRLVISTSLATNPPRDAVEATPFIHSDASVGELRERAQAALSGSKSTSKDARVQQLRNALIAQAEVLRRASPISEEDQRRYRKLASAPENLAYRMELMQSLEKGLKAKQLSAAQMDFRKLQAIDPDAAEMGFFRNHRTAPIVEIAPKSTEEVKEDED